MKIALVHDDFMQWGGAERLFTALAEMLPESPIFTSMVSDDVLTKSKLDRSRFHTSWMDKIPAKKIFNKAVFAWYPMTFENFDFTEYDIVISSSTRFAHGIITKPSTRHIAYINSPFRGFWEPRAYFGDSRAGKLSYWSLLPLLSYFREWDYIAGQRADIVIANSQTSRARVQKYYRRDAQIMYPFVDLDRFKHSAKPSFTLPDEYFVVVSRLVEWKRIDVVIQAANATGKQVLIIGTGPDKARLEDLAGSTVKLLGFVPDDEATYILEHATALIHPQKEDFGMTVLEANAVGTPVIAYKRGGATETVVEGETGTFFKKQEASSLSEALSQFDRSLYDKEVMVAHAQTFSKQSFLNGWREFLDHLA
ncbi:glycosyltransferase family 4 protein [candidate division WWE3 bacterium]|nr:glycosyltransferase family 4 protein [candidate division WWE3 bacterium]